jgi:NitT/TauT family transport system ATP-binding protein
LDPNGAVTRQNGSDAAGKPRLRAKDVSVLYRGEREGAEGVHALAGVTLDIEDGEILAILGPNGCGKTTLLMVLSGLLQPTSGQVERACGQDPGIFRRAVVFQDFGLFHWMTVEQNVGFGLEALNVPLRERADTVRRFIDLVGLAGFEKHYPRQLSGGMQQRVALARALAISPEFLFLDEPFGSLDLQTREMMQEEFHRLWQKWSVTTVLVTHSVEEAIYLSQRVVVLTRRPGRVKATIPVPFPMPRKADLRVSQEFLNLRAQAWSTLRQEIEIRGTMPQPGT